ncbi:MAG: hypothetical protein ABL898_19330, partial [Hyphomicrobiaceae bacterium]
MAEVGDEGPLGGDEVDKKVAQPALRPRDASTLVIVDRTGGEPRVLMGKRRDDLAFMAGKYVFPGGRVDRADRNRAALALHHQRQAMAVVVMDLDAVQ